MLRLNVVQNRNSGTSQGAVQERTVCDRLLSADNFLTRMVGLLGTKRLHARTGLWIKPSTGVHTFGMRYPIDVVALDEDHYVLKVWENVPPRKLIFAPRSTRSVLELAAGTVAFHEVGQGDVCRFADEAVQ